jgi:hypothetical protein
MLPIRCLGCDLLQAPPHARTSPTTWCYACHAKCAHMHMQKSSDRTFSIHTKGARTKSRVSPYPDYEIMKFRGNNPNTPCDSYVTIRVQCSMFHAFQGSYLTNPCMLHHPLLQDETRPEFPGMGCGQVSCRCSQKASNFLGQLVRFLSGSQSK